MKKLITTDGKYELTRLSRWIQVKHNYNPSKRNKLWDYVTDGSGYHPYQDKFNPKDGLFLDYFRFKGTNYAVESFYGIGSMAVCGTPYFYEDKEGKLNVIGAIYMDGNIFAPSLYAEFDECVEAVRLYEITEIKTGRKQ